MSPAGVRSPCATSPRTVTPWHPEGPQRLPRTPPSSTPCCVCPSPPSVGPCPRGDASLRIRLHPTPVQAQEEEKDTQPCLAKSSWSCRVTVVSVVAPAPGLAPPQEMGLSCPGVSGVPSKGRKVVPGYLPVDQQMPIPGWEGRARTGIFPAGKWCQ